MKAFTIDKPIPGLKVVGPCRAGVYSQMWIMGVKFPHKGHWYGESVPIPSPEITDFALNGVLMPWALKYYDKITSWWWPLFLEYKWIVRKIKLLYWRLT